jgi:hypothetical protein
VAPDDLRPRRDAILGEGGSRHRRGVIAGYLVGYELLDLDLESSRTISVSVFVVMSLYVVFALEATSWRRATWVGGMCVGLVAAYVLSIAIPFVRNFFELVVPEGTVLGMIALGCGVSLLALILLGVRPRLTGRSATGT